MDAVMSDMAATEQKDIVKTFVRSVFAASAAREIARPLPAFEAARLAEVDERDILDDEALLSARIQVGGGLAGLYVDGGVKLIRHERALAAKERLSHDL